MESFKYIEYGFGDIRIRYPYTPYSIYLRGDYRVQSFGAKKKKSPSACSVVLDPSASGTQNAIKVTLWKPRHIRTPCLR